MAIQTIQTIDKKYIMDRQGKPAVLYTGLLDAAHRTGLKSIRVLLLQAPTESNGMMAIAHATVEMDDGRIHEDIGDATPQNVGKNIIAHIVRMASTRAKARALRDALNVGGTALEEYGPDDADPEDSTPQPRQQQQNSAQQQQNGSQQQRHAVAPQPVASQPPVPDVPGACQPATPQQLERLGKLLVALGKPAIVTDGLSFEDAATQIRDYVALFNSQARGGKR